MTWPKVTQLIKTEKLDLNSVLTSCRGLRREPLGAAGLKSSSGTGKANSLPPPPTPPQAHRVRDWGGGGGQTQLSTHPPGDPDAGSGWRTPERRERTRHPSASLLPRPPVTQTKRELFKASCKGVSGKATL